MKRLVIGSAVTMMLVTSVVDVDAKWFGTDSGRSNKKSRFGHDNKDTVSMLNSYYRSAQDDATEARSLINKIKDVLTTIKGETKKAKDVNLYINAWQKVDLALESIQHYRKVDDIKPDCDDALNIVVKSSNDFAKLIGEDAFAPLRKIFEGWPSAREAPKGLDKSGAAKAIYDLYEAIRGLAKPVVSNGKTAVANEIPRLATPTTVNAGSTVTIPPPPPPRRTSSSDVDYSHNLYDDGSQMPPQFLPPDGVSPNRNSSSSAPPPLSPHPYAKIVNANSNILDDDDDSANAADRVSLPTLGRSSSAPPQPLSQHRPSHRRSASAPPFDTGENGTLLGEIQGFAQDRLKHVEKGNDKRVAAPTNKMGAQLAEVLAKRRAQIAPTYPEDPEENDDDNW